jgi:hypothetical protein
MLSAGLNGAGLTKYNLNEGNMCLHLASRLEYRSLWVAQFDEAVNTSGYDFSGIGSPYDMYDTKKRTADGTGAGGENNFAVGKHPAYATSKEERKPTPFKVPKSEARGETPKPKPKRPKTSGHGDNGQYQQFFGGLNAKKAEVEVRMAAGLASPSLSIGSFAASAAPADRRHVLRDSLWLDKQPLRTTQALFPCRYAHPRGAKTQHTTENKRAAYNARNAP